MAANSVAILKEANRLAQAGMPFCIVTVVDARGSIPQEIGAKAIVDRFPDRGIVRSRHERHEGHAKRDGRCHVGDSSRYLSR